MAQAALQQRQMVFTCMAHGSNGERSLSRFERCGIRQIDEGTCLIAPRPATRREVAPSRLYA
jgi:hypothetical protein